MKELKNTSLQTTLKFEKDSFYDSRFIKVRIKTFHNGLNRNSSFFSDEVIENAKDKWKNVFLLANVVEYDDVIDFGAHDSHIETNKMGDDENPYKVIYDESIVGIVPETNNYEYILDEENDKSYVWLTGYIARDYSNYTESICERYIEEGKDIKVSMEISVQDYTFNEEEGYFEIKEFTPLGITFLGNRFSQGMEKSVAKFTEKELESCSKQFIEKVNELKELFSIKTKEEKEGGTVDKTEFELKVEAFKLKLEEYKLTMKEKFKAINECLKDEEYFDGEEFLGMGYYWLSDADEENAFVELYSWLIDGTDNAKYFKIPYKIDGDKVVLSQSDKVEIFNVWVTAEEKEKMEQEKLAIEMSLDVTIKEKESLETKVDEFEKAVVEYTKNLNGFESKLKEQDDELTELRDFKHKVERGAYEEAIKEKLEDFEELLKGNEEFDKIKDGAFEMEVDELESALFELKGRLDYKEKFSKKDNKVNPKKVAFASKTGDEIVVVDEENDKFKKYGDMAKYFTKKK